MKKILTLAIVAVAVFATVCLAGFANSANISSNTVDDTDNAVLVQTYTLSLQLNVPRIYDNNESLGTRKYQRQHIVSDMIFKYDIDGNLIDVEFANTINKTHRLSTGKNVTYDTILDTDTFWPRFNAIGSNKLNKFKTASICFSIAAEPNYNIGEFDEDNALYIVLAGKGTFSPKKKYLNYGYGYVTGTLGCGCMAYGHVSPTRRIGYCGPTDDVDDVASVYGTWKLKLKQ